MPDTKARLNFVDIIGATVTALILFGMIFGFLWIFGLAGGRYFLTAAFLASIFVVWGWWKLVSPHQYSDEQRNSSGQGR